MAISVVSTTTNSIGVAGTSLAVDVPASLVAGDVLIAVLAVDGGSNNTMTAPAGWTIDLNYDRGTAIKIVVGHHVVDGSEGASDTWQTNTAHLMCACCVAYRGVEVRTVFEVAPTGANGSGSSATHPGATSLAANAWFVWGLSVDGTGTTMSTTTGFTTEASITTGRGAAVQDKLQAAPGGSGALSSTLGVSHQWCSALGVLAAAVPAPPIVRPPPMYVLAR